VSHGRFMRQSPAALTAAALRDNCETPTRSRVSHPSGCSFASLTCESPTAHSRPRELNPFGRDCPHAAAMSNTEGIASFLSPARSGASDAFVQRSGSDVPPSRSPPFRTTLSSLMVRQDQHTMPPSHNVLQPVPVPLAMLPPPLPIHLMPHPPVNPLLMASPFSADVASLLSRSTRIPPLSLMPHATTLPHPMDQLLTSFQILSSALLPTMGSTPASMSSGAPTSQFMTTVASLSHPDNFRRPSCSGDNDDSLICIEAANLTFEGHEAP